MPRPNLVFIFPDQLRADALGCYGSSIVQTPNLDRLAREGVRFANCSSTNPICLPSRASVITGRYCHQHHCHTNQDFLNSNEFCWPSALREQGYLTACVGKLHLWSQWYPRKNHINHGFEVHQTVEGKASLSSRVEESRIYFDYLLDKGQPQPRRFAKEPSAVTDMHSWASQYNAEHHVDGFITTRAERIIEESGRCPFALWVGICSPHEPYDPPAEFYNQYADAEIPEPFFDEKALRSKSPAFREFQEKSCERYGLPTGAWDEKARERVRRMRRHYFGNVSYVDHLVGRIISALERKGILDNTVIIFTSDHGDFLGDHGCCVRKGGFLYQANVHVPLIIRAPMLGKTGTVAQGLVQTVDCFSTILEGTENTKKSPPSSQSLIPMLKDPSVEVRSTALAESNDRKMIRKGSYKLILEKNPKGTELYDLASDPHEQSNLARDKNDPDTMANNPEHLQKIAELSSAYVGLVAQAEPIVNAKKLDS